MDIDPWADGPAVQPEPAGPRLADDFGATAPLDVVDPSDACCTGAIALRIPGFVEAPDFSEPYQPDRELTIRIRNEFKGMMPVSRMKAMAAPRAAHLLRSLRIVVPTDPNRDWTRHACWQRAT